MVWVLGAVLLLVGAGSHVTCFLLHRRARIICAGNPEAQSRIDMADIAIWGAVTTRNEE